MSINNIYCNPKVYKGLYKNSADLHNNPDNLAYYLFDEKNNHLKFDLIKKINLQTNFGNIELAIIGSSHYFLLENNFMEILTCSQNTNYLSGIIASHKNQSDFLFKNDFSNFTYSVSIQTRNFLKKTDFQKFEYELLNKKEVLIHAFEKQSAITALQYKIFDTQFLLHTWHTYPDFKKVISSESLLKLKV